MNLPSHTELIHLPPRALAGFVARCVRRIRPLFSEVWSDSQFYPLRIAFESAIGIAERFSHGQADSPSAEAVNMLPLFQPGNLGKVLQSAALASSATLSAREGDIATAAYFAEGTAQVTYASLAGDAEYLDRAKGIFEVFTNEDEAVSSIPRASPLPLPEISGSVQNTSIARLIRRDFDILLTTARQKHWSNISIVPQHLFSLNTEFEEHEQLLEIAPLINEKAIEYFRRFPERLYEVSPRKFEELIAELFNGFGFDVELTAQTADGGRDIIATSNDSIRLKCLIECKRYSKGNRIGIAIVQRLHGVVEGEDANKGILVTTSTFTRPAQEFIKKKSWLLEGRDFDGVVEWLEQYEKYRMLRLAERKYDFIRMLIAPTKK